MCNILHVNQDRSSKVKSQLKTKTKNIKRKRSISVLNQSNENKGMNNLYKQRATKSINKNKSDISSNLRDNKKWLLNYFR